MDCAWQHSCYENERGFDIHDMPWVFIGFCTKLVYMLYRYIMCRSQQSSMGRNVPHFIITIVLSVKLSFYWCSNDPVYSIIRTSRLHTWWVYLTLAHYDVCCKDYQNCNQQDELNYAHCQKCWHLHTVLSCIIDKSRIR